MPHELLYFKENSVILRCSAPGEIANSPLTKPNKASASKSSRSVIKHLAQIASHMRMVLSTDADASFPFAHDSVQDKKFEVLAEKI
jgi:hypothetical protein